MHLKKLELFGFKSFLDRTGFNFEPGVTAIVGPNGCGKTNVVDAIKWVLGEQSALALRGSHMGDVIFNGTDGRKPLGMAEVSLVLDNEDGSVPLDYSEVMITRRIFRSGESEYFINKTPCRLKDINELFMDTGIGTRSYSLIEQGKVDLILSSRPEDRRFLFEEAAGITKYKNRKKEALRKLESTERNLLRVDDIISELKKQIGSLRRQAGKAKRYQSLSEQLREFELTLAFEEYNRLESRRIKDEKQLTEMRERVGALNSGVEKNEFSLGERRAGISCIEAKADRVREDLQSAGEGIIQSESNVVLYEDRIQALNQRIKDADEEIGVLENRRVSVLDELSGLEQEKEQFGKERTDRKSESEEGEKRLEELAAGMKKKEKELAGIKEKIVEVVSFESRQRSELASLSAVDKSCDARERRLGAEKLRSGDEKRDCGKEFAAVSAKWEERKDAVGAAESRIGELKGKISGLQTTLGSLREKTYSGKREIVSMKSSLKLMEEMWRNYEGYARGVRSVMAVRDFLPGVCGVVGDLLKVPRNFEVAVEAALGERAQYIVVGKTNEAEKALSYLKQKEGGRATFVVLGAVGRADKEEIDEIVSHSGVIGVASGKVKSDLRYVNVSDLLLGRTVIVDKLETARALLPKVPAGWKLVTLEGDVIDGMRFVSGGSLVSKGTGLIGRSGRVQEMTESVKNLLLVQEKLESDERIVSADLKTSIAEEETLGRELHREREEFANLERARSQLQNEMERLSKDISLLDDEVTTVRKDRSRLGIEIQEVSDKLNAVMEDKEDCNRRMHSFQQDLEDGSSEREQILHRLTEIKVIFASLDAKEESLETAFSLRQRTCSEYEEQTGKRRQEVKDAEARVKEFEETIVNIRNDLKGFSESRDQFEEERLKVEEERKSVIRRIDEMENSLREGRGLLREKEEEMHQVEVRYAQMDVEISSLTDRISSRHRVDLKTLAEERKAEEIDAQLMSEEAVRLRAKLEAMGPVNLVAIEEYKHLEERYDFLCGQRDDLLSAQESLKKAIAHINRTTRSMFVETFRKVNEQFGRLFRSLFDGGKAELILVDERDVLESGIEIIARPPGKKLQSISLLSGGEKAMTAIALLFAIRGVKPSPFCVLDEIDAPLDDSNIGRFARLVRESSRNSQFIIVTHNRTTIATSDIVHGVTMEERGISKQISVRFEKEGRLSAKPEPALR